MNTKHHRKSVHLKGSSDPSNISFVPENQHKAYHVLWDGTKTAQEICDDLNHRWINPEYIFVCVPRDKSRPILKHLSQLT